MNIGFDAKRLFNNFTGLGNYSRFIVQALANHYKDHHYYLFTPKVRSHPENDYFLNKSNISTVLPSSLIRSLKGGSIWRTYGLGKAARKNGVDLFHGLSNELPIDIRGTKSVVTIHDLIFMRFPQFYNPIDVAIYKAKARRAVEVADRIIAISQQTADDICELLQADPAKIEVVYQGCHPNFRRQIDDGTIRQVQKKYNLPDDFILNVGTIESRKNALLLVRALAALSPDLNDVHLVIAGRPTEYLKKIQEFIAVNRLGDRVHLLHNVGFEELPVLYKLARLFVYPSLYEGFGIPLVEAISCGAPVISTSGRSCFREAAGPYSRYVNPGEPQELAFHIEQVLRHDQIRNEMILKSAEFIRRFEPEKIAEDVIRVYRSLM